MYFAFLSGNVLQLLAGKGRSSCTLGGERTRTDYRGGVDVLGVQERHGDCALPALSSRVSTSGPRSG